MRNWIPHSEKQPVDGQDVFYFFECVGVHKGKYEHPHCYYSKRGFLTGDVTHWMPYDGNDDLPEIPQGFKTTKQLRAERDLKNKNDRV